MTNSIPAAEGTLCQTGSIEKGVSLGRCAHSLPKGLQPSHLFSDITRNKMSSTIFNMDIHDGWTAHLWKGFVCFGLFEPVYLKLVDREEVELEHCNLRVTLMSK